MLFRSLLPDRDSEPPRKKRVIEAAIGPQNNDVDSEPQIQPCSSPSPQLPKLPVQSSAPPVKRGSILAFFKPLSSSTSSSAPQSQISSDVTHDKLAPSSPPSSPPSLSLPRPAKKRRRLTTRIKSVEHLKEEEERREGEGEEDITAEREFVDEQEDTRDPTVADSGYASALHELRSSLLNSATPIGTETADGGFQVKHEAKRRPRKPTVQTTLNLSMADDPGFTICKECDMLYNPLNEKDRKDHARRHAAAMRRKTRVTVR